MAMSEQIKMNVKEASNHIREAISFASRGKEDVEIISCLTKILIDLESFEGIETMIESQKQLKEFLRSQIFSSPHNNDSE